MLRALALAIATSLVAACSDSVSIGGHRYLNIDRHPATAELTALASAKDLTELSRLKATHSNAVWTRSGRDGALGHEADVRIARYGVFVPQGEERENGYRPVQQQGLWLGYYRRSVRETDVHYRSDGHDERLYVPDDWTPESLGSYVDGERQGKWIFFHPNGKRRAEGSFEDGIPVGTWKVWQSDGTPDGAAARALTEPRAE